MQLHSSRVGSTRRLEVARDLKSENGDIDSWNYKIICCHDNIYSWS